MESETAALEPGLPIAHAARTSGLSVHTLRYYERAGLIGDVDRASSGHRRYSDADMAWVEVIRCLRETGMPIARIRRAAESVRAQLAEVQGHLAFVERKIAKYEELIDG